MWTLWRRKCQSIWKRVAEIDELEGQLAEAKRRTEKLLSALLQ